MAQAHTPTLIHLDVRDPDFTRKMVAWAFQAQCEMHETVLATREIIASTKIMITQADRLLAHS